MKKNGLSKDIYRVTTWIAQYELCFLALAAPFLLFPSGWLPFLAVGLIGLTWICRWVSRGKFTIRTTNEIPVALMLCMLVIGFLISVDPAMSRTRLWNMILDFAIFYGLANSLKPDKQTSLIVAGFAAASLAITILSFLGTDWQLVRMISLPWIYDRLPVLFRGLPNSGVPSAGDLINPRWLGITMGVLSPGLLAYALFGGRRWLRIFSALVAFLASALLILTQTLAGWIGWCAGMFFLAVWWKRWFLFCIPLLAGLMVAGLFMLGPGRVGQLLLSPQNVWGIGVVLRLDIWSRALAMIRDLPYTGIGINTFPLIQAHFYPGYLIGPEPHAHNLYLQTALDLGLPGLAAFLWFFIAWALRVRRNYRSAINQEYRLLLLGLSAAVIAYLAHGVIDAMMFGSKPSILVWGILGIGAALPENRLLESPPGSEARSGWRKSRQAVGRWVPALLIPAVIVIIFVTNPAALLLNLGAVRAHLALFPAETSGVPAVVELAGAEDTLSRAIRLNPGYLQAYELLGRIYAWQGEPAQALGAFARRVALDGKDPFLRYYPSGSWLRQIQSQGQMSAEGQNWDDLIQVYSQWLVRYPERAENYAEIGLIWQCHQGNPGQAKSVLMAGIEQPARPIELLEVALDQISRSELPAFCSP